MKVTTTGAHFMELTGMRKDVALVPVIQQAQLEIYEYVLMFQEMMAKA